MKLHSRLKVKNDSKIEVKGSNKSDIKLKTKISQLGNRLTSTSKNSERVKVKKGTPNVPEIENCDLDHFNEKDTVKKDNLTNKTKKGIIYQIVSKAEVPLQFSNQLVCTKSSRPIRKIKSNKKYEYESDEEVIRKPKKIKLRKSKIKSEKIIDNSKYEKERLIRKKRNSERRKEKSRDAARCRRGKESEIFGELGALLPLEGPISSNLDKASIIRVAIAYLRTKSLVTWGLDIPLSQSSAAHLQQIDYKSIGDPGGCIPFDGVLQALDGFLIVLTNEGDVVYTSENIASFLGLSQIDVIGHSLLDYIHPCDHDEVRHLASLVSNGPNNIFLRFKCTLTPKGRNVNLKSATYKVVQVTGQVLNGKSSQNSSEESTLPSKGGNSWIVALGVPVPHPSNIEVPLDKQTFVSKHSLDMKFNYVDENVKTFCGYRPEELLGRSLYQLNHALDTQLVKDAYKTLRSKGQVETGKYRFLAHGGGYVWVVTQATLISGHRDNRPQYVVCLNFVISEIENREIIFSDCQLKTFTNNSIESNEEQDHLVQQCKQQQEFLKPNLCAPSFIGPTPVSVSSLLLSCKEEEYRVEDTFISSCSSPSKPAPVAATCSLLRDRTEDMNEGYLTFADNDSHVTILKEDPEDLTHLAPSVGEDCVPLEVPIFLPVFDDVLDNNRQGYSIISNNEDSLEKILSEPFLTSSGVVSSQSPSYQVSTRLCEIPSKAFQPKSVSEALIQGNLHFTQHQNSSLYQKVPDQRIPSPQGSISSPLSRFGFDSPNSPFSLLLSQATSPLTPENHRNNLPSDPRPTPATTKLFAELDVDNCPGSSMDLFNNFDLKLEEDLELRAPYIPPIDEVLIFDQDDLFGLSSSSKNCSGDEIDSGHTKKDDFSLLSDKQKGDGFLSGSGVNLRDSLSPNHPFQQSKNGNDTGGNFVDPNQVLPGQFYIKGEEKDNMQELRYLLEAPPPSPVKEPVDPPPPLHCSPPTSIVFIKTGSKRPHSPNVLSSTKKWKAGFVSSSTSLNQRKESATSFSIVGHGKSELPTPHAPLMQQLLSDTDPDSPLHSISNLPVNKDGKIELTRQQLSDLLDRAGAFRNTYRTLPVTESMPPTPPESYSPVTPSTPVSDLTKEDNKALLMVESSMSPIPNLFNLTSFDCEVNASTTDPSLLQGSELLMALEQSQ